MESPRWSTVRPSSSWTVFLWTTEKDARLVDYITDCIRISLETSEEVDQDLEKAVYSARFPLGVNWKDISNELECTPMDCVRRYAELRTSYDLDVQDTHVVHSPRLEELISSSIPSSPMLSPPPFALRNDSKKNRFKWDDDEKDIVSYVDEIDFHSLDIEELTRDLNGVSTDDSLHFDASSLTQSVLEEAFLDMTNTSTMPR